MHLMPHPWIYLSYFSSLDSMSLSHSLQPQTEDIVCEEESVPQTEQTQLSVILDTPCCVKHFDC